MALIAAFSLFGAARAEAVSVSPAALYIDARSPMATLTLFNDSPRPAEVEISFSFGYARSDSAGNLSVPLTPVAPAGEPSAVPWLRVFPRRLVLAPGQQQDVRVFVQPPAGLAEGEYWARVLVASRGDRPPVEQTQGGVQVQVDVETVVATPLVFRKGAVRTGVRVEASRAQIAGDAVELTMDLVREGNAAFVGRMQAQLVGPSGAVLSQGEDVVAVYREIRRKFRLPLPPGGVPTGSTVRYAFDTKRPDLPLNAPLPIGSVTGTLLIR
jgi:hypothetical protein